MSNTANSAIAALVCWISSLAAGLAAGFATLIAILGYRSLITCDLGLCIFAYAVVLAGSVIGATVAAISAKRTDDNTMLYSSVLLAGLVITLFFSSKLFFTSDYLLVYLLLLLAIVGSAACCSFLAIRRAFQR